MELVEFLNRYGPPTVFTVQPVEPADLIAGGRLLPHVGIELRACYQIHAPGTSSKPVMEAVTATGADGVTASIIALGPGMSPAIRDYPLPAGMTIGDAVRQHWYGLEYR